MFGDCKRSTRLFALQRTFALALAILYGTASAEEQSAHSDRHALNAIFAEQHVTDTALDVHRHAMRMAVKERFVLLSQWVLPGVDHETLRLQVGFSPTNPAPPVDFGPDNAQSTPAASRLQTGGELISPVFDLLDAAQELGRLPDLRDRVNNWNAGAQRDAQIARFAMLTLIDLARKDIESASLNLEQLLHVTTFQAANGSAPSPAELLVFHRGLEFAKTREAVAERLFRDHNWMTSDYYRSIPRRHVSAMLGRMRTFQLQSLEDEGAAVAVDAMQQWSPVSRTTAATRGPGSPPARWYLRPGFVENVASHDEDYLYFALPLRGNYEVECDVSGFEWRDSHLLVAGTWVAPIYTHAGYDIGSFRGLRPRVEFTPPLTKVRDWIHYRTVVHDGTATTYFNGRKVHEQPLSDNHDPWLAIRSSPRHDGAVRNLRITGDPLVPEELRLLIDEGLHSWLPYCEVRPGPGSDSPWYHAERIEGDEIGGVHRPLEGDDATEPDDPHAPGYRENLLRYHRPMLEDGTIEYDFYYVPGRVHGHPALDRLAFLLYPDGVRVHWITDGVYDRTGLSPGNIFDEPDNRRGPDRLPLKAGDWNRLRLQLTGDTVTLALNGQEVYERRLEPTNQRTFGLFYYSDRTQARVRNVVWRGNWPRKLPPLTEQELFVDETGFIDKKLPELTAVFSHDFAADGLPQNQFTVIGGAQPDHISADADGLHAGRAGLGGYRNATVAPNLHVAGDFDITASFDQLVTDPRAADSSSNIMLIVMADNQTADEAVVMRRRLVKNGRDQQLIQCFRVERYEKGDRRHYFAHQPVEAISGTLRLARRGDKMYYLFAETDSRQFRLIGQEEFPRDDLQLQGVRLLAQIHGEGGSTSVVWKNLTIRAEKLSGPALEAFDTLLAKLNRQRDGLAPRIAADFSKQAPDDELFYHWNKSPAWKPGEGGWTVVAAGTEDWTSAGTSLMQQISGDFDIESRFEVLKFEKPKSGKRCAVYLQFELPDKDRTAFSLIFCNDESGKTWAIAQFREPQDDGEYVYRKIGTVELESVSALRIARRGERLTFLASTGDDKQPTLVGTAEFAALPIRPSNLRFMVHTGGAGLESRVLWKSLDIRAEKLEPEETPADEPKPKGVLESFLDLLR